VWYPKKQKEKPVKQASKTNPPVKIRTETQFLYNPASKQSKSKSPKGKNEKHNKVVAVIKCESYS